jgi:NAD(P)-dependent dehydrogenase (short-subunit alcohol dehydrogenase family)
MNFNLAQKSVVVTGGASNIGEAIVLGFAREGAKLIIADLDLELAEQVAGKARELGAASVTAIRTDVTDYASVEQMFDEAARINGDVSIFVNSVGWDKLQFFTQTSPELWHKIMAVNFEGLLNCTHVVLKQMVETGGSIVAVGSDASRQGEPREAVYGAMKAGINSFMKTVARENGRFGVRCNVVCPGVTVPDRAKAISETSMWKDRDQMFTDEQLDRVAAALPLKKHCTPEDVSNAVLFLSSDQVSGHITGQVLSVSGGYSMVG